MNCRCFYCGQPIGSNHNDDCVLIKRRVKIRATFEYEVDVPASWGKFDIENHRNLGSWCADNALRELDEFVTENGCLCPHAEFEFVADSGPPRLDE